MPRFAEAIASMPKSGAGSRIMRVVYVKEPPEPGARVRASDEFGFDRIVGAVLKVFDAGDGDFSNVAPRRPLIRMTGH